MSTKQTETFTIDGMNCMHCVAAVRDALKVLDGVTIEDVDVGSATVAFDPGTATRPSLVEAIEEAGYSVKA
jgi:copper chaperone CopZ